MTFIMKGHMLLLGLVVVCIVQWAIPLALIQRGQATLAEGTAYKFRTAPVDPSDPFRGRYVTLDFDAARVSLTQIDPGLVQRQRAYASIRIDENGYAQLHAVSATAPNAGDYLPVTILWVDPAEVRLSLPFDRYYLDEQQAPQVEQRYRDSNRRRDPETEPAAGALPTYATVRVLNGYAVLENLVLNGEPVK